MASKRKANAMAAEVEEPIDPADELMFLCLGGGNEVGRSCHIIQYKGKTVMLDAGSHAGYSGLAALPFYDDFDLSTVDVLLISHFHIDHAGSLPYVLAKTNFRGRIFMTHPTKSIYKWLLQDSIRVTGASTNASKQPLYTEEDHLSNFPRIEAIDYHTTHTISSIRITPYPAGHVLGAAMFLIEIAGLKILFTGDYSREEDRHLIPASVPKNVKIDVLITESTYGIASHISRVEREQALMKSITGILNRGGRVLMPVFALGRAQELLLILNEYWSRHKEVQKVPIYYASNLARKCMAVYQTYIGSMNENIRRMFREGMASGDAGTDEINGKSPWDLRYIRSLKTLERFDDMGECVMLASPGMMQNGVSRHLLERWAPSDKNGVIITGYSVEGTMARMIMMEPDQIPAIMTSNGGGGRRGMPGGDGEKVMIPRRCSVQELSFAAHVSGVENREFIEEVGAPVVILVHGEQHNMMRLKSKLLSLNADKSQDAKVKVFSPRNCEELKIPFKADKTAKVVGKLASMPLNLSNEGERETKLLSGVLVQNDFKMSLMAPEDLREYAGLTTTTITCKQRLRLSAAGVDLVKWALEGTFGGIDVVRENNRGKVDSNGDSYMNGNGSSEEEADEEVERDTVYLVMGCVTVRYSPDGEVELEWEGNMLNDGIADAVMAVLFSVESSPAAVKQSSSKHSHSHDHDDKIALPSRNPHAHLTPTERLERLFLFLEAQFGSEALTPITTPRLPTLSFPPTAPPTPENENDDDEEFTPAPANTNNMDSEMKHNNNNENPSSSSSEENETTVVDEEKSLKEREAREMQRLFKLGIPVPGVEIKVDKWVARVWLDDLEVECEMKAFGDRVRAVVERAVEVGAPLWG